MKNVPQINVSFHILALFLALSFQCLPLLSSAAETAAVSLFIQQLSDADWQQRREAAVHLGVSKSDDKVTVAALDTALADNDSRVRRAAADALGQIGPAASRSIPKLVSLFDDIDTVVIESSARAVGLMGSRASRARADLTGLLQHSDARVRTAAAQAIGRIGARAKQSMPELGRQLGDTESSVRAAAAESLGQMGLRASAYSSQLVRLLGDNDAAVRQAASRALGQIGKPAVEVLVRALQNGDPIFLQAVVETLGKVGKSATPMLIDSLQSDTEPTLVRQYAALALAEIGSADKRVLRALIAALEYEMPDLRRSAVEALGQLGPPAAVALPKLISLSLNPREDVLVREFAITALAHIAPQDDAVTAALVTAVSDGEPRIYAAGVSALEAVRRTAVIDSDISSLIGQLQNAKPEARIAAAQKLGETGPYAAPAVAVLTEALAGQQNPVELRIAATQSLGLIGPRAEAAIPALIRALEDENLQLSNTALVSLGRIGPQTRTIPGLLQAMKSNDLATRAAAAAKLERFAQARIETWQPLLLQSDAPVLRNWLARHAKLYDIKPDDSGTRNTNPGGDIADYFDVLGGRAAIRESIQLNLIAKPLAGTNDSNSIPVSSLRSVQVTSHPFDKVLEDSVAPVPRMPLAELAPQDHFFAYFRNVDSLREVFANGADAFLRFESTVAVKSVEYDLEQRYLSRLGLESGTLDQLQIIGAIGDLAIITPDLFFVDGTDVTIIARLTAPQLAQSVFQLLGLSDPGKEVGSYTLSNGDSVYWAIRANVLAISSRSEELSSVLALQEKQGKNSLGRSDEFLYMLQQMGVQDSTEAYFYLSDAFIRQLVSPEFKIAQLRRMQARAEMEMLAAGALLYLLDGHKTVPTKQVLIAWDYVPRYFEDRDYMISEDLIVTSKMYGTIATLRPLSTNPVNNVSQREKTAYAQFVDSYSRYWRQFFDPIAIRLNRVDDNTHELTMFILPLLDSRLYEQVTVALASVETGRRLDVPILSPVPSMIFSLNVSDDLRISLSKMLAGSLVQYTSVNPEIFDSIGSGVHLAVQDSTPIVALGSGDIWGVLDKNMLRMEGFDSFLPFLLSLMTQPATVLIQLAEPDQVKDFLNEAVTRSAEGGGEGELHRLQDKEAWIYSLNVVDMFRLHLRVEIKNNYLLISNMPWSTQVGISGVAEAELSGAQLQLNLNEITQQLPALHTKVFTDYRKAAVDGMGYLYPLLITGVADTVPEAIARHSAIFGFKPVHPDTGQWLWRDSYLESTEFGSAFRPTQPEFSPGQKDFGLFPRLETISVNMQLEDSGLRTRIRWRAVEE